MIFWICWAFVAPLVFIFFPTRIIGKKHLKMVKKQGAIISPNHQSNMDGVIIKARVNPTSKVIGKDSLFKNKFFGWLLKKFGAYPVKRGSNDIKAVKTTLSFLKNDKHILIFPEGTRIESGDLSELKHGLVSFALKTDCYIVPMIFRKKPKFLNFNTLLIGNPFKFSELDDFKDVKISHDVLEKACNVLASKMQYLKEVNIKAYKKSLRINNKK